MVQGGRPSRGRSAQKIPQYPRTRERRFVLRFRRRSSCTWEVDERPVRFAYGENWVLREEISGGSPKHLAPHRRSHCIPFLSRFRPLRKETAAEEVGMGGVAGAGGHPERARTPCQGSRVGAVRPIPSPHQLEEWSAH